jgi:photosystem II stability/assembly factor-like uncharacterized protein
MKSGTEEYLLSIWGTSDDDIFAVGDNAVILHYDGKSWEPMQSPKEDYWTKVKGLRPDCVYAVGDNGAVIHYDGTKWNDMSI